MKNRGFWYLFGAQAISSFGDYFGFIALEWMFYGLTGSKTAMGMLAFAFGLSEMVSRFALSPLIDRMDRIRLMAALDLIRFAGYGLFALLGAAGYEQEWHYYLLAVVIGGCNGLFAPASMAVVPSLIGKDQLVRGFSLMDASVTVSVLAGPSLAAFVVSWAGPLWSVGIDSTSFFLSGILVFMLARHVRLTASAKNAEISEQTPAMSSTSSLSKPALDSESGAERGLQRYVHEMLDGLRFFKYAPALLFIQSLTAVRNMCSIAAMSLIIPYGVEHLHLDVQGIGFLTTAGSVGGVVGTLFVAWLGDVRMRRIPMLASIALSGFAMLGLGLVQQYWAALALLFCFGLTGPLYGTFSSTLYAQLVPEPMRGRVQSARMLVGGSLQPIGSSMGGWFSQTFGIASLFMAAGIIPIAGAAVGSLMRSLKGINGDLQEIAIPQRNERRVRKAVDKAI